MHPHRRCPLPPRLLMGMAILVAGAVATNGLGMVLFLSTVHAVAPVPAVVAATHKHRLTLDSMSQAVRRMDYAVRGKVVLLAHQISQELASPSKDHQYSFDHIVYTNIGNPQ